MVRHSHRLSEEMKAVVSLCYLCLAILPPCPSLCPLHQYHPMNHREKLRHGHSIRLHKQTKSRVVKRNYVKRLINNSNLVVTQTQRPKKITK